MSDKKQYGIKHVLLNMTFFLKEHNEMLEVEARHLRRNIIYIKEKTARGIRFHEECNIIDKGIVELIKKTENCYGSIIEIRDDLLDNMSSLIGGDTVEKILLLDCAKERSYSLAEKLAYFLQAYENLVARHNYLHIPMPHTGRRIKSSNLMLYFNKMITEQYKYLIEKFYNFEINDEDLQGDIFSTWCVASHDHLKVFDETPNHYISFNFWLMEQQFFYPIAYHEIGHVIYDLLLKRYNKDKDYDKRHSNYNKSILLDKEQSEEISKQLHIARKTDYIHKEKLQRAFVQTIYQDIISDIGAYIVSGEGYINSLFYTGFMRGIYKNFYKDIEQENLINVEHMNFDKKRCKERHKNLTLLTWTNTDNDMISFFVRLHILIDIHKELSENVSEELQAIRDTLDLIYPRYEFNEAHSQDKQNFSLASIMSISKNAQREYEFERSFVMLAYLLLKDEIDSRTDLKKLIKKCRKEKQVKFVKIAEKIIHLRSPSVSNGKLIRELIKNSESYYDFVWKYRFDAVKKINKDDKELDIYSGRILRFKNLCELGVFDIFNGSLPLDVVIYELVFFKFQDNISVINEFMSDKSRSNLILEKLQYAFGPFDFVCLEDKTTREVDRLLAMMDEQKIFFTERHALYLLHSYKGKSDKVNKIDLIVAYSSKNEFKDNKNGELRKELEKLHKDIESLKDHYSEAKIFASMGNENFLIFFEGVAIEDAKDKIVKELIIKNSDILGFSYSTMLLSKQVPMQDSLKLKLNDSDIYTVLCKLKKQSIDNLEDEISEKAKESKINMKIYRLFGVFDYKFVFNSSNCTIGEVFNFAYVDLGKYFSDIQIEYQFDIVC